MPTQTINFDEELLNIIKRKARENSRSISKEVVHRVKQSLIQEEAVSPPNSSVGNNGDKMT